ncbi:MAG: anti-phage ZorAB system protein ZorA [Candidatus Poribacteria bacterium]|nr:anti-phage ZorAB system protein ZorA [Candidatus Poribacteria bacterium]
MNEFLTLLFPWKETPNDQISDIFVYIIGASFLILLIYFVVRIYLRYNSIRNLTRKISQFERPAQPSILQELKEEFARKTEFTEAWQEFEDSLITRQRDENEKIIYKTDEASYFFSEDRLLGQYMNLRFWNSIPAILVGFGILGTFVGLVWGLIPFSDTDFQNTEEIKNAIEELLSGVSTAFVTSVWGMVASLFFNGIEKLAIGGVHSEIANLQRSLDRIFTLKVAEEIAFRLEDESAQQTAVLKTLLTDLGEGIEEAMRVGRKELIQELHTTTDAFSKAITEKLDPTLNALNTAISSFEKNIIDAMSADKQEIIQEIQNAPEAFSRSMVNHLQPSLDRLNTAVEKLRQEKEESSTEAIRELVEEFKKALSGSFTEEIETLVKNLSTVSQSLLELPNQMRTMMDGVQEKIDEICESLKNATDTQTKLTEETIKGILDGLRFAITELNGAIDSITSNAATESSEMIKQIRDSVNETTDRLKEIFKEGETNISKLLDRQNELIEAIDIPISKTKEALETGNVLLQGVNTSLNNANDMIVTMQVFSDQLKGSASTLTTAGENLTKASDTFNQQNAEYLKANQETNKQIQESLQQSRNLLTKFAEEFNIIKSGLQGIFEEIDKGLINYSTTTHDSMGKSLDEFSKHLADAADKLAGSVSALDNSVEELSDMIEQFSKLRRGR